MRSLSLRSLEPISQGTLRRVYIHPDRSDYLVKIIRPALIDRRWGRKSILWRRFRRSLQYIAVEREVVEFLAAYAQHGQQPPFLQRVVGFTDCDLGLGFITEAIMDDAGNVAPSLGKLVSEGCYDAELRDAFERFASDFLLSDLVIGDFSLNNLVYGRCSRYGNRLVLIDGIGCPTFFPVKAWLPWFNRISKRRQLDRIRKLLPAI